MSKKEIHKLIMNMPIDDISELIQFVWHKIPDEVKYPLSSTIITNKTLLEYCYRLLMVYVYDNGLVSQMSILTNLFHTDETND